MSFFSFDGVKSKWRILPFAILLLIITSFFQNCSGFVVPASQNENPFIPTSLLDTKDMEEKKNEENNEDDPNIVITPPQWPLISASPVDIENTPTKIENSSIEINLPSHATEIQWLDVKIPIEQTYRFQGYFPNKMPWHTSGLQLEQNTYDARVDLPPPANYGSQTKIISKFSLINNGYFPVTYQLRKSDIERSKKLRIQIELYGWSGASNYCENFGSSPIGFLSIRNCSSEYPTNSRVDGLSYWTFYGGNAIPDAATNTAGARIADSILSVMARHPDMIDNGAGIKFIGTSYGAGGSILQSMILPKLQSLISVVEGNVPATLAVKSFIPHRDEVVKAWGNADVDSVDFRKVAPTGKVDNIFYRINGGSEDYINNLKMTDTEFFQICNDYKIACVGTWHGGGHTATESGIHLPRELYPGDPNMDVRLDSVLPVFTNSTGNTPYTAARGHYNLGLSWNLKGVVEQENQLSVPLKYRALKGLSSDPNKPLADMPDNISASVTIRRSFKFKINPGSNIQWQFGSQSGSATAHPNKPEVTINNLQFSSSENIYKNLVLTH